MLGSLQRVFNYYLIPGESWLLKIHIRERIITEREEVNEMHSSDGRMTLRQEEMIHFSENNV